MTREKYESLPLSTLKEVAKTRGLRGISTMKKADLIDLMLEEDDKDSIKEAKEEVKSEKAGTADIEQLDSGRTVNGILEVMDGYGFIRSQNYLPGADPQIQPEDRGYPDRKYKSKDTVRKIQCASVSDQDQWNVSGRSSTQNEF